MRESKMQHAAYGIQHAPYTTHGELEGVDTS